MGVRRGQCSIIKGVRRSFVRLKVFHYHKRSKSQWVFFCRSPVVYLGYWNSGVGRDISHCCDFIANLFVRELGCFYHLSAFSSYLRRMAMHTWTRNSDSGRGTILILQSIEDIIASLHDSMQLHGLTGAMLKDEVCDFAIDSGFV